jgi:protein-disulfide isomerase
MSTDNTKSTSQYLVIGILTAQVLLSVLLLLRIHSLEQSVVQSVQAIRNTTDSTPAVFVADVLPGDGPSRGPAMAPVTIIEFSDFQCPYCAQAIPMLKRLMDKYSDQVRFVYRNFPLETIHPNALNAALAAECANEQEHFWQMHDALFADQKVLDVSYLEERAIQVGLDMVKFRECMSTQRYIDKVRQDVTDGQKYGVRGTPTFFVNGYRYTGSLDFDTFDQIVQQALSNK